MDASVERTNWTRLALTIGLWLLTIVLAASFLGAGGTKLAGLQKHIDDFARWGYPDWLRIVVGLIEVGAAILVLIPRVATIGAAILAIEMLVAIYTDVVNDEPVIGAVMLCLLAVVVGVARFRDLLGNLGRR